MKPHLAATSGEAHLFLLRFFAGLTEKEIAGALSVSEETERRDWRLAKSWWSRFLNGGQDGA